MAQKLTAAIPDNMVLDQDYIIRFTAVDAATGAVVSAVKVSNASILASNLSASSSSELDSGPFMLVPGPGT